MDDIIIKNSVCAYYPHSERSFKLHTLLTPSEIEQLVRKIEQPEGGKVMAPTHNLSSEMESGQFCQPSFQNMIGNKSSTTTLQSVLRGEVPTAYSHLATGNTSEPRYWSEFRSEPVSVRDNINEQFGTTVFGVQTDRYIPVKRVLKCHRVSHSPSSPYRESDSPYQERRSPSRDHVSPGYDVRSPYLDSLYYNHENSLMYPDQKSPFHESRNSPFRDSVSPYHEHSQHSHSPSPYAAMTSPCPARSPMIQCSSPYIESGTVYSHPASPHSTFNSDSGAEDAQPIDLTCKSELSTEHEYMHDLKTICDSQEVKPDGSLLRNLLCGGKEHQRGVSDSDRQSCTDSRLDIPINNNTRVTLAKKNMYPISSRVSDWLLKSVKFAKSIPEFSSLSQNDRLTLLINSWTRLLLLFMAEHDLEFAVTPLSGEQQTPGKTTPPDVPSMKSVEEVQSFIKKCRNMNLDPKEYALLRMAVIFNAGYSGLDNTELVDQLNSVVQQLLHQHVQASRPDDVMHYSRLLMCLPALYGINCRMFENLFCRHINNKLDMEVLLKEMLQTL